MNNFSEPAAAGLDIIREKKPLIHNITNFVVMNYTANALLAMGASPVMAHAPEEVEEMVSLAGALVLNIGTLTGEWVSSMIKAGKKANELKIPVILDPVGSGATNLRTDSVGEIIDRVKITVIKGNASEILSLKDVRFKTRGVDSVNAVEDAADIATGIAKELDTTIVITGRVDFITDGSRTCRVYNGHPLLSYVTGTGCTAAAVIGAFLSIENDPLTASAAGLAMFGLAGEWAAKKAETPGAFQIALLDSLYEIKPEDLKKEARIR